MSKDFRIICNWPIVHGDMNKSIDVKYINNFNGGSMKRDDISDIISDDKIVLLENDGKIEEKCQLTLNIKPTFNLHSITFISSRSVVEIFKGSLLEYYSTVQGDFIADYDGTRTYRYDLIFSTKILTPITIKFITNLTEAIWLFGMQIVLAENKNFLQNMLQSSATAVPTLNPTALIDMKSVQSRLTESNVEVSTNAEKCKNLIEHYTKIMSTTKPLTSNNSLNMPMPMIQQLSMDDQLNGNSSGSFNETTIKSYIDYKFNAFETRMNEKFDKIISLLEENNNKK